MQRGKKTNKQREQNTDDYNEQTHYNAQKMQRQNLITNTCINLLGGTILSRFLFQKRYVSSAAC